MTASLDSIAQLRARMKDQKKTFLAQTKEQLLQ